MNVLEYLENKEIKDNPRIIDVSGQVTDFYLQTLLEDFKKQLILYGVSQQRELLKSFCEYIDLESIVHPDDIEIDIKNHLKIFNCG
jgi:hypothetical protein